MNSNIPQEFLCPITQNIMKDPVSLQCGHSFDKEALENWLRMKNVCPTCRKEITVAPTVNWSLKSLIDRYLNKNDDHGSLISKLESKLPESNVDDQNKLENLQSELSKIKAVYSEDNGNVSISLKVPECENGRRSVSFVCLIDVSGSMDDIVGAAEKGRAFTRLDLVKHVLNVLVASLNATDQISLITFSDESEVVLELVSMTPENKTLAKNLIKNLCTIGGTNTLPGIHKSYELMKTAPKTNIQSIILLTDGQDTVGKDLLLRGFKLIEKDSLVQFNTFGISNNIWSDVLSELATKGGGIFGFIPDQTMIGTVFVNFIANTFEMFGKGIVLQLSKGFEFKNGDFKKEITLNYGKSRNFLIIKNSEFNKKHPLVIKLGLGMLHTSDPKDDMPMIELIPSVEVNKLSQKTNIARNKMLTLVRNPQLPHVELKDYEEEINQVKEFSLELQQPPEEYDGNNEQIKLGLKFWETWGQHYIRSFAYAHMYELCLNFKSPSMSIYRTKEFDNLVDKLTDLFCTLPPPIPSANCSSENVPVIGNMSSIMNRNNGCILGKCIVKLADNTLKKIADLKKGDQLEDGSKVICLIKSNYNGLLVKINDLFITPYHPVFYENDWHFPIEIYKKNLKKSIPNPFISLIENNKSTQSVCNLVLDKGHLANIENFKCVTLGHGFNEDVVKHDYYGSEKVIKDLSKLNGWDDGLIILNDFGVIRDASMLVTGIILNEAL